MFPRRLGFAFFEQIFRAKPSGVTPHILTYIATEGGFDLTGAATIQFNQRRRHVLHEGAGRSGGFLVREEFHRPGAVFVHEATEGGFDLTGAAELQFVRTTISQLVHYARGERGKRTRWSALVGFTRGQEPEYEAGQPARYHTVPGFTRGQVPVYRRAPPVSYEADSYFAPDETEDLMLLFPRLAVVLADDYEQSLRGLGTPPALLAEAACPQCGRLLGREVNRGARLWCRSCGAERQVLSARQPRKMVKA